MNSNVLILLLAAGIIVTGTAVLFLDDNGVLTNNEIIEITHNGITKTTNNENSGISENLNDDYSENNYSQNGTGNQNSGYSAKGIIPKEIEIKYSGKEATVTKTVSFAYPKPIVLMGGEQLEVGKPEIKITGKDAEYFNIEIIGEKEPFELKITLNVSEFDEIPKNFESEIILHYGGLTNVRFPENYNIKINAYKFNVKVYPRINKTNEPTAIEIEYFKESKEKNIIATIYNSQNLAISTIELNDYGRNIDKIANDNVYTGMSEISEEGEYYTKITICEKNTNLQKTNSSDETEIICSEEEQEIYFQLWDTLDCIPLFEESVHQNIKDSDRINIVFLGSKYDTIDDFKLIAEKITAIDGESFLHTIINDDNSETRRLEWGLFSIEPFKSNKNKFNIWYIPYILPQRFDELIDEVQNENIPESFSLNEFILSVVPNNENGTYLEYCELGYVYPAFLVNGDFGERDMSNSGNPSRSWAKVIVYDNPLIDKETLRFRYSFNSFPLNSTEDNTSQIYSVFAHETGHAVFGLQDEYEKTNSESDTGYDNPQYGYPNCAKNIEEAEEWWGDLEGQIDPFYYSYSNRIINNSLSDIPPYWDLKIGFHEGGCGSEYGNANVIRPTKISIMRSSKLPVFGSVNRARIEQILDLFDGT